MCNLIAVALLLALSLTRIVGTIIGVRTLLWLLDGLDLLVVVHAGVLVLLIEVSVISVGFIYIIDGEGLISWNHLGVRRCFSFSLIVGVDADVLVNLCFGIYKMEMVKKMMFNTYVRGVLRGPFCYSSTSKRTDAAH